MRIVMLEKRRQCRADGRFERLPRWRWHACGGRLHVVVVMERPHLCGAVLEHDAEAARDQSAVSRSRTTPTAGGGSRSRRGPRCFRWRASGAPLAAGKVRRAGPSPMSGAVA